MLTEKETIRCEAVFNDEHTHRYMWKRVWNKDKPLITVIMLHPCFADTIICDTTSYLVVNNVMRLGMYGGVSIVNLYAKMTEKIIFRWEPEETLIGEDNDVYIKKAALESDEVVLAWGRGAEKVQSIAPRIDEVMSLLSGLNKKLLVISDDVRTGLHPLTPSIRSEWKLIPYEPPINAENK